MTFAADLYGAMAPLARTDVEESYALRDYTSSIADPFEWVVTYASDGPTWPGWSLLLNPATCPVEGLPWLAQFVGVELNPTWTEAQTRVAIAAHLGFQRGTPRAIQMAGALTLTGTHTVYLIERLDGNAYQLGAVTFESETPNPDQTEAAIRAAVPGGIVVTYNTTPGAPYGIAGEGKTYADWKAHYATYKDLLEGNYA